MRVAVERKPRRAVPWILHLSKYFQENLNFFTKSLRDTLFVEKNQKSIFLGHWAWNKHHLSKTPEKVFYGCHLGKALCAGPSQKQQMWLRHTEGPDAAITLYFAGRERKGKAGRTERVWNQGSDHFPLPITSPQNSKGNDDTEVTPRNSKGPSLGIIMMHEEGHSFLRQQE